VTFKAGLTVLVLDSDLLYRGDL